jgi:hypothetical protein
MNASFKNSFTFTELNLIKVTVFAIFFCFQLNATAQTECFKQGSGYFSVQDPYNGRVFELSSIEVNQLQRLHREVLSDMTPAYFQRNLEQGRCVETAINVEQWLKNRGLLALKVNIQTENGGFVGATGASFINGGAGDGNVFLFESPISGSLYSWSHHVAVALCVVEHRGSSRGQIFVLDPSILSEAVSLDRWQALLVESLPNPSDPNSWSLNFF